MYFIGISNEISFLEDSLVPLNVRWQISALGLIHCCVLNKAPGALFDLFNQQDARHCIYRTRLEAFKHNKQTSDIAEG